VAHTLACPAPKGEADLGEGRLQPWWARLVAAGQAGDLLGEDPPGAVGVVAEQAAHLQPDPHLPATDAMVAEPADVAAVDAAGGLAACWAIRRRRTGGGVESDRGAGSDRAVDVHPCHVREQDVEQRNPHTS
jgi:hypothetical protein